MGATNGMVSARKGLIPLRLVVLHPEVAVLMIAAGLAVAAIAAAGVASAARVAALAAAVVPITARAAAALAAVQAAGQACRLRSLAKARAS